jgi:hypothetical protein
MEASAIRLEVVTNGYTGNWHKALDEAKDLATRLDVQVLVSYARQHNWLVNKDTDIEEMKKHPIRIGV